MSDAASRASRDDVVTADANRARLGPQQADEHFDRGRLAGAVVAQQRIELAGGDAQIQAVDRHSVAVRPADLLEFDHRANCVAW